MFTQHYEDQKWHSKKFKEAKWGGNCGFVDISWFYKNLVICSDQVNFGEDSGSIKSSSKIMYVRNWKLVRNRDIV